MLKKMRRRFILAAMAAFVTVVVTLLCIINMRNYRVVSDQLDEALVQLVKAGRLDARGPLERRVENADDIPEEVVYLFRFFSVDYDTDGNITGVNQKLIPFISQEQAEAFSAAVLSGGKAHGYYKGYRYLVDAREDGTTVAFLNAEQVLKVTRDLMLVTVTIAAGCLGVVFVLVLIFSRRAIMPYMRNMEVQKQFITNASHELKTPLTAISTSADVLAMEYENDEWVQSIQAQTAKLSKLITNLITLSRLDEENPFPVRTAFSLSDALWETAEPFCHLAQAKGKALRLDIENDLTCIGDHMAIQQMISVLLDNALKYAAAGGTIRLTARRTGKKAEIAVANPAEVIPDVSRLFDRFYRADESHSNTVSGTGIGLSIARATAEAHGGTIRADAKVEEIIFTVKLPLAG